MLKGATRSGFRLIVAIFAIFALFMAGSVTVGVIDRYGHLTVLEVLKRSSIVAAFTVVGFVMISYLVRELRMRKHL